MRHLDNPGRKCLILSTRDGEREETKQSKANIIPEEQIVLQIDGSYTVFLTEQIKYLFIQYFSGKPDLTSFYIFVSLSSS